MWIADFRAAGEAEIVVAIVVVVVVTQMFLV